MPELLVIRHGQASFGTDNYDRLSDLGKRQSDAAGAFLRRTGWVPDRCVTGTLIRQIDTLNHMGFEADQQHPGFNEYDFHNLLSVRFGGETPEPVHKDRRTHFRTLRETIFDWQKGDLVGASETYAQFCDRIEAARLSACADGAERVLVISSGGVIGRLAARAVEAPPPMMMTLNLQVRNTSFTRFVFKGDRFFLNEFNSVPHISDPDNSDLTSYS